MRLPKTQEVQVGAVDHKDASSGHPGGKASGDREKDRENAGAAQVDISCRFASVCLLNSRYARYF